VAFGKLVALRQTQALTDSQEVTVTLD